ncbi:MAG: hypothetical protein LBL59_02420 [Xanthomonadaceae bacterium]|jgi:hypothetical protein|nr:hypothetical protein [Xanthomonadaceae bacterium]
MCFFDTAADTDRSRIALLEPAPLLVAFPVDMDNADPAIDAVMRARMSIAADEDAAFHAPHQRTDIQLRMFRFYPGFLNKMEPVASMSPGEIGAGAGRIHQRLRRGRINDRDSDQSGQSTGEQRRQSH